MGDGAAEAPSIGPIDELGGLLMLASGPIKLVNGGVDGMSLSASRCECVPDEPAR
jgi:hypothetical protein